MKRLTLWPEIVSIGSGVCTLPLNATGVPSLASAASAGTSVCSHWGAVPVCYPAAPGPLLVERSRGRAHLPGISRPRAPDTQGR